MDFLLIAKAGICETMIPIMTIAGYAIFAIKIGVPVILIIVGMADLAKAITQQKDDDIKKAQMGLVKKAVAAVMVFLVITIVGLIFNLIGNNADYTKCAKCAFGPFDTDKNCCYIIAPTEEAEETKLKTCINTYYKSDKDLTNN